MNAPPRPAAPGRRWVRGRLSPIRAVPSRVVERTVDDSCVRCFLRVHRPERCDEPGVTEWFEIDDGHDVL